MRKLILLLAVVLLAGQVLAQRTITGTVTGKSDGQSLPGVTVLVKGTSNGTVTDTYGKYSLNAPAGAITLVFSFIGMQNQEVLVNAITSNVTVALETAAEDLAEVVVVGYGTAKKVGTIVGSIQKVSSEKIKDRPVANVLDALQGKVSGLQVFTSNGEPSTLSSVRLHGVGSLSSTSSPLFVIDGVPISSGDILSLNPNDIESATVLKDASATSIYGSRAANGVIYITTKNGMLDTESKINFNVQYGVSKLANEKFFTTFMNTKQLTDFWVATAYRTQAQVDQTLATYNSDTKWYKYYYNDQAPTYQADLSFNGGGKKSTYFISGSYFNQDGIMYRSGFERYTLRSNIKSMVKKWLTFGLNVTGDYDARQTNGWGTNNTNGGLMALAPPFYSPYDKDGKEYPDMIPGLGRYNPKYLADNNPSVGKNVMLNGSTYLQFMPFAGMTIKTLLGLDAYDYNVSTQRKASYLASLNNGYALESFARGVTKTITNTIEYKKRLFTDHQFTALVGHEGIGYDYTYFSAESSGQTDDRLMLLTSGPTGRSVGASRSQYAYLSYFGRLDYGYKEKYFADFSIRNDQSSRFGKENRSAMFYAGGLMWNGKKESFLKNVNWLSSLNVKFSIGTSGNSEAGNYASLALVGTNQYNASTGWYVTAPGNPDLGWEKQTQSTLGLKFSLFEDKYRFNIEGYDRRTENMYISVPYPYTSGFSSILTNVGTLKNTGIDIALDADIVKTKELVVTPYINLNFNKNEVTELFQGRQFWIIPNTGVCWVVGKPVSFFYPLFAGVDPATGNATWYKQGADKVVTTKGETTTAFASASLEQNTGFKRYPPIAGGFGLNARYKDFSLVADFAFALGKYLINNDRYFFENPNVFPGYNQSSRVLDYWKQAGDQSLFPRYGVQFTQFDSRLIENASFMRLKNITLGYSLPKSVMKASRFFESIRLFITGRNVLTVTNYLGPDPEVDSNLTYGVNPNTKQFSVGAALIF
jgi:TonB-linked SusC/RagA family outer membrane protein